MLSSGFLTLIFAVAGMIGVAGASHGSGAPSPAISLLVWNVRNYQVGGSDQGVLPKREDLRRGIASTIADSGADTVLLIEMGGRAGLEDLKRQLASVGCVFPEELIVEAPGEDRQICLLSRWKIGANDSVPSLPLVADGRPTYFSRGMLDATLKVGGQAEIRLIGLHLKSAIDSPGVDAATHRAAESLALRRHLDRMMENRPATKVIVAGDLNDSPNSPTLRRIRGWPGHPGYLEDLRPADSRGEVWTHFYRAADEYARIDYILHSANLSALDAGILEPSQRLSDHRPLRAKLCLRPD